MRFGSTMVLVTLSSTVLSGCLLDMGRGPELGACADIPDGAWTYGEAGIGTCLAGPTDVEFMEKDGQTFLLVSNADPYNDFSSGSLLVVDFDSIDLDAPFNTMDGLSASAVPAGRYLGQIGLVQNREDDAVLALVPSRHSPESNTTDADDTLYILDLTDPSAPVPWAEGDSLTLGQDPFHVAVGERRAWVLNRREGTVSVIDTRSTPLQVIPISSSASLGSSTFEDADASGSNATVATSYILDEDLLLDDEWTLTWSDSTWRAWAVSDEGVERWQVGSGVVIPAATGPDVEIDDLPAVPRGPFAFLDEDDLPVLAFGADGNIRTATNAGTISVWTVDDGVVLRGSTSNAWEAWLDGPAFFDAGTANAIAYTARTAEGAPGVIGIATTLDDVTWTRQDSPALDPADHGAIGYQDPSVAYDAFTRSWRMWLSVQDSEGWHVAVSESADALSWSEPVAVQGLDAQSASPTVSWTAGRYVGWFSLLEDDSWALYRADSVDGVTWTRATRVLDLPSTSDLPPRAAIQTSVAAGFAVEARDEGRMGGFARDGDIFDASSSGFYFRVATGHALGPADIPGDLDGASTVDNGLVPGARFETADGEFLLATTLGSDGRNHLGLFAWQDGAWVPDSLDVLDLDDLSLDGASDPVIHGEDGAWTLWFATTGEDGRTVIRTASSTDGRAFTLGTGVFDPDLEEGRSGVRPGSIQELDGGQLRLWFTAMGRVQEQASIWTALSSDGGATWAVEGDGPAFESGTAGTFDDTGVSDPRWFTVDGQAWLAYTAYDGSYQRLGVASLDPAAGLADTGPWVRRTGLDGRAASWLAPVSETFAEAGVGSPVVQVLEDGVDVWFAGLDIDEGVPRLGRATGTTGTLFPAPSYPTAGDQLVFRTTGNALGEGDIVLAQTVEDFTTDGLGATAMRLDEERGFLYIPTSTSNNIIVLDVRDDSTRGDLDDNLNDIEGIVRLRSVIINSNGGQPIESGSRGMFDALPIPGTDHLYVTGLNPSALLTLDLFDVVDDDSKQVHEGAVLSASAMRRAADDAGVDGIQGIPGAGMALRDLDGRRHLFVTHFRDNSVSIYDLDRGAYGEPVGYAPNVGENPHAVAVSPDGRYAVVANYLGYVDDSRVSSTLVVLDADPASPTFGQVLTTLVNR